jgi:hypothetical protein
VNDGADLRRLREMRSCRRRSAKGAFYTSLLSYLAARPSNNLIVAGQQALSRQWWELRRSQYRLCISELVTDEAARGNPEAAKRRLDLAAGLQLLELDDESDRLTEEIIEDGTIPEKAAADAAHIAVATRHGMDYLLTWNCRHIANAVILRHLAELVSRQGYELPIICTPYELFGEDYVV